jgi:diacylglycerol kinase (ATP)
MSEDKVFVPKKAQGFQRVIRATGYSMAGIKAAIKGEAAFRQELILTIVLIPVALFMPIEGTLRLILVVSTVQVLALELLNSAIEAMVDRVCEGYDPYAKRAKDMGSGAVFIALIVALISWGTGIYSAFFS